MEAEQRKRIRSVDSKEEVTYNLDDMVDKIGFGLFQVKVIVICGLIQAFDVMELFLLSMIGPVLGCAWQLDETQQASLTTVVFMGMTIGAPIFGVLADRLGRRGIVQVTSGVVAYFGLLSAASPTVGWIMATRAIVGAGIAGLMASNAILISELMPRRYRHFCILLMIAFDMVGGLFQVGLAALTLGTMGWRGWLAMSALPITLVMAVVRFLPESPRYNILVGRNAQAQACLDQMARENGHPPLRGRLEGSDTPAFRGRIRDLWNINYRLVTLLLFVVWFGTGINVYGAVLSSVKLTQIDRPCLQNLSDVSRGAGTEENPCCISIGTETFIALAVSNLGGLASLPLSIGLIDSFGRKRTVWTMSAAACVAFFCQSFCMPAMWLTFLFFVCRTFLETIVGSIHVYTNEVYPTSIRAMALGCCSGLMRLGAVITPFIAQVMLMNVSTIGALMVYVMVSGVVGIAAFCLPIETKGRPLNQSVNKKDENDIEDVRLEPEMGKKVQYNTF